MIITIIFVLLSFLSLAAVVFLTHGRTESPANHANLRKEISPLDIEAFRNLIDYREEEFLRENLEPADFRFVQRERLLAAAEYIRCASRNAAILHSFGESARRSENPSVAAAGNKLANSAIQFRLNALRAIVIIYAATVIPGASIRRIRIAEGYDRMTSLVVLLGCLQFEKPAAYASAAPQLST